MITRTVPITQDQIADIEDLGTKLLYEGDIRASVLLTLALAWKYAPVQRFACVVDESAGLAEVHSLDTHSRKVSA